MLNRMSNSNLKKQLITNVKRRELWQKFLYLDEGANNYYSYALKKWHRIDYLSFFKKHFGWLDKPILISLGCGNAWHDKEILEYYQQSNLKLLYFWVDTSQSMLEKARENLQPYEWDNINVELIHADFMSDYFINNLYTLVGKNESKIFSFLGSSFCNINQTSITDTLYNMLGDQDSLWIDIPSRVQNEHNIQLKLFENYSSYLDNEKRIKFWFYPLKKLGVPIENWKIILETSTENSVGSILFSYYFVFLKKTVVQYKGHVIHFLPDESIRLHSIRNYFPTQFKYFFWEHEFQLVDEDSVVVNDWFKLSQYLFKTKHSR